MAKNRLLSREEAVFFADFLPASGYFPGLCVSPAVVNALRLSSPPQFSSKVQPTQRTPLPVVLVV